MVPVGQFTYETAFDEALRAYRNGFRNIQVAIEMYTSKPQRSKAKKKVVRSATEQRRATSSPPFQEDATQSTHGAVDSDEDTFVQVDGTSLSKLRHIWACKAIECDNYTHSCYWLTSDSGENHYPLTKPIATAWANEVENKGITVYRPSLEVSDWLAGKTVRTPASFATKNIRGECLTCKRRIYKHTGANGNC